MKIPPHAFDDYAGMGRARSYKAIAERYGVSKRAVVKCAERERWAERMETIEREARERGDKKLAETLEGMRERHLVTIRAMQTRALTALQQYPLSTGMEAMKAAEVAIKLERLVAGEPTERSALSVEDIRQRYERWTREEEEFCSNGERHEER